MKAKVHMVFNSGKAVEIQLDDVEMWLVQFMFRQHGLERMKEMVVKPDHGETITNPNADVKQAFPKGRW